MYKPKLDKDIRCPLEYGLDVSGGKWNSRIICVLAAKKTLRYSELRSELTNITDAVPGASLKALMKNGMMKCLPGWNIPLQRRGCLSFPFCRASAGGRALIIKKMRNILNSLLLKEAPLDLAL